MLILLTSSHTNPFVVDDMYLNPAIETLKLACGGGTFKSVEHLQKYVGKYRSEVESDFSDILQGLQMKVQGKSVRFQRKHATDFHEIKYADVLTGQSKLNEQVNSTNKSMQHRIQSAIQKMVIGVPLQK